MCHPDRRDMIPGRTYSFVMWAGDAKGRESAKSNRLTVTLPVDTAPPAAPDVSVTDTTSSIVRLAWGPVSDDDSTCCKYRIFANGVLVSADNLQWTGERAVTVLRLAAATTQPTTRYDWSDGAGRPLRVGLRLRDVALLERIRRRRRPATRNPL
jgi:hypothetical protein